MKINMKSILVGEAIALIIIAILEILMEAYDDWFWNFIIGIILCMGFYGVIEAIEKLKTKK